MNYYQSPKAEIWVFPKFPISETDLLFLKICKLVIGLISFLFSAAGVAMGLIFSFEINEVFTSTWLASSLTQITGTVTMFALTSLTSVKMAVLHEDQFEAIKQINKELRRRKSPFHRESPPP